MEDASPGGNAGTASTSQVRTYLATLFAGKPPESYISVWTTPDKRSRWFTDLDEAARAIEQIEAAGRSLGIYVGLGLRPARVATAPDAYRRRGVAADITGFFCLWSDIDILGPGHKHTNLPRDAEEAHKLFDRVGVPPTMIIFSGGGLHAYWIFKEPWLFDDDPAERDRAYELSKAWQRMMQAHAAALGWGVDGTFDLTRVLRVPGTTNRKPEMSEPAQCKILQLDAAQLYDPSDLRDLIQPEIFEAAAEQNRTIEQSAQQIQTGNLSVDLNCAMPMESFDLLSEVEPRFRLTWLHKRPDIKDQSPSGWDMSLASFAANGGWSEQEIINLLIHHRRRWGYDLKRPDYFTRTVAQAMKTRSRDYAIEELRSEFGNRGPEDKPAPMDAARRAGALDFVSSALGTRIKQLVRYTGDPPEFTLKTSRGDITLGVVENLINQPSLRAKIAAAESHYFPQIKKDDWEAIAQALLDACETIHTGPESTDEGQAHIWLDQYLEEQPPGALSDSTATHATPFYLSGPHDRGRVYVTLANFRDWLFRRMNEKITSKKLGVIFRKAGFEPAQVPYTSPATQRPSTKHVWRVSWQGIRPEDNGQHKGGDQIGGRRA